MKKVRNLNNILKKRVRPALLAVILLFTMGFSGYVPKAASNQSSSTESDDKNLSITKLVESVPGDDRTFDVTLTVNKKNWFDILYNVSVDDYVSNNFEIITKTNDKITVEGNHISWKLGNLSMYGKDSVTYRITAKDTTGGENIAIGTDSSRVSYNEGSYSFGITSPSVKVGNKVITPQDPEAGLVKFKKTVKPIGNDKYRITFNITGKPKPSAKPQADIVLAIDRSGSMKDKLSTIKQAAQNFCNNILVRTDADVRISIITFSSLQEYSITFKGNNSNDSWIKTDTVLTSNNTEIYNAINGIKAGGGTNTEAGIWRVGQVLDKSKQERPNASRYVVLFTDGLPTVSNDTSYSSTSYDRYFKDAQKRYNAIIGGLSKVGGIGEWGRGIGWDNNSESVDPNINAPHKDAKFYSMGMFSGDKKPSPDSKEVKFLSTIQNVMPSTTSNFLTSFRDKYVTNNDTDIQTIFSNISNEIKADINNLIAVDAELKDVVTPFFKIPDVSELEVEGIEKDKVSVEGRTITFKIGKITETGITVSFVVDAVDPYYSNNDIATNEGDAKLNFKDPIDGSERHEVQETQHVNIAPKQVSLSIENKVFDEVASSETKGKQINDDKKFSICLNRSNGKEKYIFDLSGNTEKQDNKTTMNFYLKGDNTDISPNLDMTKTYVAAGNYSVSEIVPMDYQNKAITITAKHFDTENNKWITDTDLKEVRLDGYYTEIEIVVENNKVNNNYWRDRSDVSNIFNYTAN